MFFASMPSFFSEPMTPLLLVFSFTCASDTVVDVSVTPRDIWAVFGAVVVFPVPEAVNKLLFVVWTLVTEKGIGPASFV